VQLPLRAREQGAGPGGYVRGGHVRGGRAGRWGHVPLSARGGRGGKPAKGLIKEPIGALEDWAINAPFAGKLSRVAGS
jgi:hypothetical protein